MTNRPDCWPWEFRKIDGVWHRRPRNSVGEWQQIIVITRRTPPEPRNNTRATNGKIPPESLNEWHWQ